MEEDINRLENFLEYNSFLKNAVIMDNIRELEVYMSKEDYIAIEHLMARNKELEEEVNFLRKHCFIPFEHEKTETLGELVTIEEKTFVLEKDYIPKSKVRELKENIHYLLDNNGIARAYQLEIDRLFEELLED